LKASELDLGVGRQQSRKSRNPAATAAASRSSPTARASGSCSSPTSRLPPVGSPGYDEADGPLGGASADAGPVALLALRRSPFPRHRLPLLFTTTPSSFAPTLPCPEAPMSPSTHDLAEVARPDRPWSTSRGRHRRRPSPRSNAHSLRRRATAEQPPAVGASAASTVFGWQRSLLLCGLEARSARRQRRGVFVALLMARVMIGSRWVSVA